MVQVGRGLLAKAGKGQPVGLGLIEIDHYDSEEFRFRDGHLLLRGNNGTGIAWAQQAVP